MKLDNASSCTKTRKTQPDRADMHNNRSRGFTSSVRLDPDGMDVYLLLESGKTILALKQKDKNTDTLYASKNGDVNPITKEKSNPTIFNMKDTNGDGQYNIDDGVTVKSGLIGQLGQASNKGDGSYLSTRDSCTSWNNYL